MLSTTSGYALRTLACLAQAPGDCSLTNRWISEKTGVPANYLSKMLLALRNVGLVNDLV